jgi:mannose-P-dolichol utilization defect protein 1
MVAMELEILGMNFGCVLAALSDAKIPDKGCLLPLISKLLGYAIVAASTTVKLPQILKILKHGSVRGLSVASFELEVVGYTIALAYCIHKGLPFSAYGELAFLLIQAIILVAIIYYYSPPMGSKTWMKALLYCGLAPTVLAGKIDPGLFEVLYASQHAIFFFARVPQIWKNFTNKGTGELSFLTCFMNFAGSIGKFKYMPNINYYIFNFWLGLFANITVSQHRFKLNSLAFNTCGVHILNCKYLT